MFKRILRSLLTFAALVVVYQAYVSMAVPWMEPPLVAKKTTPPSAEDIAVAGQAPNKYQRLLANYFPADHWSQTRLPKVIASSNEQAMLVLDDYDRHDDGRVEIERFAMLVFPNPPREDLLAPRDAIVLEAPQGAKLQFDDFRPERGQIGRITRGEFPGRITIRSDMHDPGPQDDLLIETADVEMNTKLMYTTSPVRFRMGPNVGGGRELEIRFLADEHARPNDSGLKIAGIDALELRRDVRLRLFLETDSLLPGDDKKNAKPTRDSQALRGNEPKGRVAPKPPVEITCSGPFHFDFVRYVASFDRDVELRQVNPNGPSDQLSAQQLDIHFAPRQETGSADAVLVDPAKRQQRDIGRLEPAAIVAQGHPVVVISPSRSAEARGGRVQLGLRDRRVVISGGSDVKLVYESNVLRAPAIEYQHPAPEAATKIGRFRATGPGSLDYVFDPAKPEQSFQATWQKSVELDRHEGQPMLTLDGRPRLAVANMGALAADRIHVFVREVDANAAASGGMTLPGAAGRDGKLQVVPERMTATGRVEIESPQLTGLTDELLVNFRVEQPTAAAGAEGDPAAAGGGQPSSLAERMTSAAPGAPPQQAYHIDTDRLRIEVAVRGQRMSPTDLVCDGNVLFREIPLVATSEKPLEVRGGQLTVDQLDSDMHITILGAAAGRSEPQVAQVAARGMTVLARAIQLNEKDNRLWIDGPGKANMLVSRDLNGKAADTPVPLEISWRGGLNFNGRVVMFDQGVLAQGADDWLRCDRLTAWLTAPVQFGKTIDQKNIDLSEVQCEGHVEMDHESRDVTGLTSHERLNLARLMMNQQTGAISGDGPGTVQSTHFAAQLSALATPQAAASANPISPQPSAAKTQLHYLRIDFQRGLVGNIHLRGMKFQERVRTVYGPVDAWEQQLDGSHIDSLPPDSIVLKCDELWVNEDPLHAPSTANPNNVNSRPMGSVQLRAVGNVRIDGQSAKQGTFGAEADWASYEQAKDVFLLKGNPRVPAKVWQRRAPGDDSPPFAAQTITYNRATGEPSGTGIQYLEYIPAAAPQNALRPTPVRQ